MSLSFKLKATVVGSMLLSASAMATFPTIDVTNLQQNIQQNIEQITSRVLEEAREKLKRQIEKSMSIKQSESDSARDITKIKADQDLATIVRNSEIAEQQAPLVDACSDVAAREISQRVTEMAQSAANSAMGLGDDACSIGEDDKKNRDIVVKKVATYVDPATQEEVVRLDAEQTVQACRALLRNGSAARASELTNPQVLANESLCFESSLLSQSSLSMYESKAQYLAAKEQVELMTEPLVRKKPIASLEVATPTGKKALLREFRKDLLLGLAQRTLYDYVEWKKPLDFDETSNNPESGSQYWSEMVSLEMFNAKRIGDPEWVKKVTNTHPKKFDADGKEYSYSPSQLQREGVMIDAFLAHMAVLQYQSMLKQEVLQAAILSIEVNELK